MKNNIKKFIPVFLFLNLSILSLNLNAGDAYMSTRYESATGMVHYNFVRAVQSALTEKGYDPGPIDGDGGPKTTKALKKFQNDNDLEADGIAGKETLQRLGLVKRY